MREIKFRGKIIASGSAEWIFGSLVVCTDGDARIYEQMDLEEQEETYADVDPKTVGQYVGLTDKNGKEIYEGDIILWRTESGGVWDKLSKDVVKFEKGCFVALLALREMAYIQVIGNIYE